MDDVSFLLSILDITDGRSAFNSQLDLITYRTLRRYAERIQYHTLRNIVSLSSNKREMSKLAICQSPNSPDSL
jgi:hypothetical protein